MLEYRWLPSLLPSPHTFLFIPVGVPQLVGHGIEDMVAPLTVELRSHTEVQVLRDMYISSTVSQHGTWWHPSL